MTRTINVHLVSGLLSDSLFVILLSPLFVTPRNGLSLNQLWRLFMQLRKCDRLRDGFAVVMPPGAVRHATERLSDKGEAVDASMHHLGCPARSWPGSSRQGDK